MCGRQKLCQDTTCIQIRPRRLDVSATGRVRSLTCVQEEHVRQARQRHSPRHVYGRLVFRIYLTPACMRTTYLRREAVNGRAVGKEILGSRRHICGFYVKSAPAALCPVLFMDSVKMMSLSQLYFTICNVFFQIFLQCIPLSTLWEGTAVC